MKRSEPGGRCLHGQRRLRRGGVFGPGDVNQVVSTVDLRPQPDHGDRGTYVGTESPVSAASVSSKMPDQQSSGAGSLRTARLSAGRSREWAAVVASNLVRRSVDTPACHSEPRACDGGALGRRRMTACSSRQLRQPVASHATRRPPVTRGMPTACAHGGPICLV